MPMSDGRTRSALRPTRIAAVSSSVRTRDATSARTMAAAAPASIPSRGVGDGGIVGHDAEVHGRVAEGVARR